jgi:hypothetical protein
MSRQHQAAARTVTQQKEASPFKAPSVAPPTVQKKSKAKLPEWNPNAPIVDPLARLSPTAPIQAKLTVGAANDKYEQEADRVAKNVVQRINSPTPESSPPDTVQRETAEEDLQTKSLLQRKGVMSEDASPNLESEINRAKGKGRSLDTGLQRSMGQAMGVDFSHVNVHTDARSDALSQSIQAKAFTTGKDVFFKQGAYQPGNRSGQELIAHELTHVVQQNQSDSLQHQPQNTIQRQITKSTGEFVSEKEAASWLYQQLKQYFTVDELQITKQISSYVKSGKHTLGEVLGDLRKQLQEQQSEVQDHESTDVHELSESPSIEHENDKTQDFETEYIRIDKEDERLVGKSVMGPDGTTYPRVVPLHAESYQVQKGTTLGSDGKIFPAGDFTDNKDQPTQRLGFNPAKYQNLSDGALNLYEKEVLADSRQLKSFSKEVMEAPAEKGYKFSDQESKYLHSFHIAKGGKFATLTPKPGIPQQEFIAARNKLNEGGGKGTDVGEHCPYHTGTHYKGTPPGGAHQHTYNESGIPLKAVDAMLDSCVAGSLVAHDGNQGEKEAVANRVRKAIGTPGASKADSVDQENGYDPLVSRMEALGRMDTAQHTGPGPGRKALYGWLDEFVDGENTAPEMMNCWQSVLWAARSAGLVDNEFVKLANDDFEVSEDNKVNTLAQVMASQSKSQSSSHLMHPQEVEKERHQWYSEHLPKCKIPRGEVIIFGSGGAHVCLSTGGGNAIELDNRGLHKSIDPKLVKAQKKYESLLALEAQIKDSVKTKKQEIKAIQESKQELVEEDFETMGKIRRSIRDVQKQMSHLQKKELLRLKQQQKQGQLDPESEKNQKGERIKNEVKERKIVDIGQKYFGLIDGVFWGKLPSKSEIQKFKEEQEKLKIKRMQEEASFVVTSPIPELNEFTEAEPVFKNPPDYIHVKEKSQQEEYKVKAGQSFLNMETIQDFNHIGLEGGKTSCRSTQEPDVLEVTDGHHRFVGNVLYAGVVNIKMVDEKNETTDSWKSMKWQKHPNKAFHKDQESPKKEEDKH